MQNDFSVIVFDLGNVLLSFDYQPAADKLESVQKGLGKRFLSFYYNNYQYHRDFERGDMAEDKFVEIMLSALNHKLDKETFCKYYSEIFSENKKVVDLLPKLKKSFTLVLLSNTNIIHYKYGWKGYDFLRYFDHIVTSYEARAVKPEEKIYKAVESFTGVNPARHFFIDDIKEYVDTAEAIGWSGVQFKDYKSLSVELINRGILSYGD